MDMEHSNSRRPERARARVIAVKENLVEIEVNAGVSIMKNEVGFILVGGGRFQGEVLRVRGNVADMQVFEHTHGVRVGDPVELSGQVLSVRLGPGLLGQVVDGLQNPLKDLAEKNGIFLPRGVQADPLDPDRQWLFEPTVAIGDTVVAGRAIGTVQEGPFAHTIFTPFDLHGEVRVSWICEGRLKVEEPVARIEMPGGTETEITMSQSWPVRRPLSQRLLREGLVERLYPCEPLTTTIRVIDTFFPIAAGGTACIPGPFGAGKTVLQSLIAQYAAADIVVIVACGERAGEVVETITEYPETSDPRTGGSLMDRTIIVCNTSSMPVAARESSIYTGITMGEYYRHMGYKVLVIADSTSRWAQAMRETSGRMEEIPGEEAYPAYLDSSIKSVYERAGVIRNADNAIGSLTIVGTVSPAGGNFEEPVTQATLATVKAFLGLSAELAYRRYYPAIDPLVSWSRYVKQLTPWFAEHLGENWVEMVAELRELLSRGDGIFQMMEVTGEEGVTLEDFVLWQKSVLVQDVYLQQDAFDAVDASTSLERQGRSFRLLVSLVHKQYEFEDKEQARGFFTKLTNLYKNWNYASQESAEYQQYLNDIEAMRGESREEHSEEQQAVHSEL